MFNDAKDTGEFIVTNSSEITTLRTQNLTWVREDFHKSAHEVEVTVAGDNANLFGEGNIKLKVKLKISFLFPIRFHSIATDCRKRHQHRSRWQALLFCAPK